MSDPQSTRRAIRKLRVASALAGVNHAMRDARTPGQVLEENARLIDEIRSGAGMPCAAERKLGPAEEKQ